MIRVTAMTKHTIEDGSVKSYIEAQGLSSDTKPTEDIITGSIFVEVDTGKVFFFDEAGTSWVEQFSFQE